MSWQIFAVKILLLSSIFVPSEAKVNLTINFPRTVPAGSNVTLNCSYTASPMDHVNYLSWFQNDYEFYSYWLSNDAPKVLVYPIRGANVDNQPGDSEIGAVQLRNVTTESSGRYVCEIGFKDGRFEAGLPHSIVLKGQNLTVV